MSTPAKDNNPWPTARPLRLATRGSPLALVQARLVSALLRQRYPGLLVEETVIRTRGDALADVPLEQIGGQGAFVKEVETAVLDGRADVAVHSAKDLPSQLPAELRIVAVPERGDPRDALVGGVVADLAPGATVATGSARRRAQLANLRPDLTFVDLRGNMARRVGRADDDDVQAVVVAKVALDRLGWDDRIDEILEPSVVLPQVGQGAIAVECRSDDVEVTELVRAIDDRPSHRAIDAERALLRAMGGSCTTPIAAWAQPLPEDPDQLLLHALTASLDGRIVIRSQLFGDEPETLGASLADRLFQSGASVAGATTGDDPLTEGSTQGSR